MKELRMQEAAPIRRALPLSPAATLGAAVLAVVLSAVGARASEPSPAETVGPVAASQADARRPAAWHVVKHFDFNEADLGNEGDLPMYWFRFKGADYADFPRYAAGWWDRQFGFNSPQSFRLDLNGGNVGYYYSPNTISIEPGQDIRIEALVRPQGLHHARALLEVSFNDARGETIAGSRRRSVLLGGAADNDRWTRVSVLVPGKFPAARYVNLSVFALQPSRWRAIEQTVREQAHLIDYIDVHGKVWFDEITIYRLPRVTLTTGQPAQLLPADSDAIVHIRVEGFANQPLEAELAVRDVTGRLIDHKVFESPGAEQSARSFQWQGGGLPAGLYRAELRLYAAGGRTAGLTPLLSRYLVFAQLPPESSRASRGRGFGLVLDAPQGASDKWAAQALAEEQARAIARLPVSLVKLPLWRTDQRLEQLEEADPWTDQMIRGLVGQRIGLVAVFGQIPAPLQATQVAAEGPDRSARSADLGLRRTLLDVFCGDANVWRPYLACPLARYAEQMRYWQIGPEDDASFAQDPRFVQALDIVRKEFRTLLTAPTFAVTWPALYAYNDAPAADGSSPRRTFPADVPSLFLSNRLAADSLTDYVNVFAGLTDNRPWATVEPLEAGGYHREPRLADLAWRLVNASAGLAEPLPPAPTKGSATPGNLFILAPWTVREASGADLLEPAEELLIFRTAAELLSGSRYGGPVSLADGLVAHIFDRGDGTGALAVRNVSADPTLAVEAYLGEQVTRVDIWGNRQAVRAGSADPADSRLPAVTAGRLPFYLDGIDPRIARLRASFALEPGFVPSSYKRHVRQIRFFNSFSTPISGRLTLHFPASWEVHPKVIPFSVQAGQWFSRDVEIRFPYNAEAGVKRLIADLLIDADRAYRIQVANRFEFGLGDVDVKTLTQWLPNGELMVTLNVTNRSDSRLDLFCFVVAPDRPRQERVIAGLPAGAAAIKSFRVEQARELIGQSLRVGLREVRGSRLVNYDVPIR